MRDTTLLARMGGSEIGARRIAPAPWLYNRFLQDTCHLIMAKFSQNRRSRRSKTKTRAKKSDPVLVDGQRPRPLYVDYKDLELLGKLTNRHGRIVGRRKSGCSAVSQHAVSLAIKRARFMALMPYVGD